MQGQKIQTNSIYSVTPVFPSNLSLLKVDIKFPKDYDQTQITRRLFGICMRLFESGCPSTYQVIPDESGELRTSLLLLNDSDLTAVKRLVESPLSLLKESKVDLKRANFPVALRNLLNIWLRVKLSKLGFQREGYKWIVPGSLEERENIEADKRTTVRTRFEFTDNGTAVLWLNWGIQSEYSISDLLNEKLEEAGLDFTIQEIGNQPLEERLTIQPVLTGLYDFLKNQYCHGDARYVRMVQFPKSGGCITVQGEMVSVLPEWSDKHRMTLKRTDVESAVERKGQLSLEYFQDLDKSHKILHDYITQTREVEYSPEFPVIMIKTRKRRKTTKLLSCVPSDVLIPKPGERRTAPPDIRLKKIEKILRKLVAELKFDFPFLKEEVVFSLGLPSSYEVKSLPKYSYRLEVRDNTGVSPLPMLSQGGKPLAGEITLHIVYLAPNIDGNPNESEKIASEVNRRLDEKLKRNNLGRIASFTTEFYNWIEGDSDATRESLRANLGDAIEKVSKSDVDERYIIFPVVIGPSYRGRYYEDVKQTASSLGKHSQIIQWNTAKKMDDYQSAVIALSIYVEAILQENIDRLDELDGLVWRLRNPSDKDGKTIYVGFDHSYDKEGRVSGVFAMICDSYGRLISAQTEQFTTDYVTEDAAFSIFRKMITASKIYAEKKGLPVPQRIVFFRDGDMSRAERSNIQQGFNRARKTLKLKDMRLVLVEVIKRHPCRLFEGDKEKVLNPSLGTMLIMPPNNRVHVARGLLVASEVRKEASGQIEATVAPVELRIDSVEEIPRDTTSYFYNIAREYVSLAALNFWSPFSKTKLCLPLRLADELAELARMGVRLRLPK